jgi:hypothetical protein
MYIEIDNFLKRSDEDLQVINIEKRIKCVHLYSIILSLANLVFFILGIYYLVARKDQEDFEVFITISGYFYAIAFSVLAMSLIYCTCRLNKAIL